MDMTDKIVVLVTCGSAPEAKRIARTLVERGLAACVNVFGARVRSTYRWKGEVETAAEYLLLVKSSRKQFPALRREVERLHSYEVPEVIALPIAEVKSSRKQFPALRREVERLHSYEVPEVIALPIAEGSSAYLRWLGECLGPTRRRSKRKS